MNSVEFIDDNEATMPTVLKAIPAYGVEVGSDEYDLVVDQIMEIRDEFIRNKLFEDLAEHSDE